MTLKPLSQTRTQPQPQTKAVIAPIPPRDRHPSMLDLELAKTPQEVFIDRMIVNDTRTLSRDVSHATIMITVRAKSTH